MHGGVYLFLYFYGMLFKNINEHKYRILNSQFVEVKQLNTSNDITTYETVNQKRFTVFSLSKNRRKENRNEKHR